MQLRARAHTHFFIHRFGCIWTWGKQVQTFDEQTNAPRISLLLFLAFLLLLLLLFLSCPNGLCCSHFCSITVGTEKTMELHLERFDGQRCKQTFLWHSLSRSLSSSSFLNLNLWMGFQACLIDSHFQNHCTSNTPRQSIDRWIGWDVYIWIEGKRERAIARNTGIWR